VSLWISDLSDCASLIARSLGIGTLVFHCLSLNGRMTMGGPIPDARQRVSAHRDSVPVGLRHPGDSASIYQLEQPEGDCGHCTGHAHAQRSVSLAAGMDPFLRVY
jgi:hypothetical protein